MHDDGQGGVMLRPFLHDAGCNGLVYGGLCQLSLLARAERGLEAVSAAATTYVGIEFPNVFCKVRCLAKPVWAGAGKIRQSVFMREKKHVGAGAAVLPRGFWVLGQMM